MKKPRDPVEHRGEPATVQRLQLRPGEITEVHFRGEIPVKVTTTRGTLNDERRPVPASFGPYLAGLRRERGLSLREAATELGVSHPYLSQIERGERLPRVSEELVQRIAVAYDRQAQEVRAAAGLRAEPPADRATRVHEAFRALVLHPALAPRGMDAKFWLDSFSLRQKLQWIEFAKNLVLWDERANQTPEDQAVMEILDVFPVDKDVVDE